MVFDSMSKAIFQSFTGRIIDLAHPSPEVIDIEDIAQSLSMTCRFGGHCRDFYSVAEHSVHAFELLQGNIRRANELGGAYYHAPWLETRLQVLLHDAAEAYVGDVISPLKRLLLGFREVRPAFEAGLGNFTRKLFKGAEQGEPVNMELFLGLDLGGEVSRLLDLLLPGFRQIERSWHLAIGERFGLGDALADPSSRVSNVDMAVLAHEALALFPKLEGFWTEVVPQPEPGMIQIECWSPREARLRFMSVFREIQAARGFNEPWTARQEVSSSSTTASGKGEG